LNIRKKGAAIAFSAMLLSALVATLAAPFASAGATTTSAGTVPRGGTSVGTATFTFTENAPACFNLIGLPADGAELSIVITDSASGTTVHFSGTPVVTAPGSLAATASLSNNTLNINFGASDSLNIEQISVSGLAIAADVGATDGAIKASLTGNERGCVITGGTTPGSVGTATATGTITAGIGAGWTVGLVIDVTSACLFDVTGAPVGNLVFNNESKAVSVASALGSPGAGQQTVDVAATSNAHAAAEAVSQTVVNCAPTTLGSPGTIGSALTETNPAGTNIVNVGENNQDVAGTPTLSETPAATSGTLTGTVTFTITTAGVLFSASPTAFMSANLNGGASQVCSISIDRKSCSVSVTNTEPAANPGTQWVRLGPTIIDVDATVAPGTAVKIVASNGATPVIVSASTVAFVGRVVVSVAAQPVIYIGFNDQESGMKTLTEQAAGFFQGGGGSNNRFGLCLVTGETFTRAPWAVVTAGNLTLLSGVVGVTQIAGTLTNTATCAYWTVYTASTVASTIDIRGSADGTTPLPSGATNGPRLSVPLVGVTPGSTQDALLIGLAAVVIPGCTSVGGCLGNAAFAGFLSQAIRAFKNSVSVTASSQPNCTQGSTDCLLGNIVITETQNGQFKAGDTIRGWFVPTANNLRNDVFKASNTHDLPIITTNTASGLLVTPVIVVCPPNIPLVDICFFAFTVTQQSFGPSLGQVTVSNVHATIAVGADNGPINMDWGNTGIILGIAVGNPASGPLGQPFESVVSNGKIGAAAVATTISNSVGVGIDQGATFGTSTALPNSAGSGAVRYATWKAHMDPSKAGEWLDVMVASKTDGTWSSFSFVKRVKVDGSGNAYFHWKGAAGDWVSVSFVFLGNDAHAPASSKARQALVL